MNRRVVAYRAVAGLVPLVLWTAYFVLIRAVNDIRWPLDLWIGTVIACAVTALFLSVIAVPPAVPGGAWEEQDSARIPPTA